MKCNLLAVTALLLVSLPSAFPQQPAAASPPAPAEKAPIPIQIRTARNVFVSYGGADLSLFPGVYSGRPDRIYSDFYEGLRQWNRFNLVATPAEADLVIEVRLLNIAGAASGRRPVIHLTLTDPKTHIALWVLDDELNAVGFRKRTRDSKFSESIGGSVDDLRGLVEQILP